MELIQNKKILINFIFFVESIILFNSKKYSILIFFLIFLMVKPSFASTNPDTSGVYVTKMEFFNNQMEFKSVNDIKEKNGLFWSFFNYEARGTIGIKQGTAYKTFLLGSIYGFNKNGIKYVYNLSANSYLALLFENEKISFMVEEQTNVLYHSTLTHERLFYIKNHDELLKEFNKKNIRKDFFDRPIDTRILLNLYDKIKTKAYYFNRKGFFEIQRIIQSYISE